MSTDEKRRQFEDFYLAHAERVVAFARRRTALADASDVVAETFLVAWRRFDEIPADPLPWLLGVARKVLLNTRRSARRRAALVARLERQPALIAETALGYSSLNHGDSAVLSALRALSPRDREALMLVAWDGLTTSQAAAVVGCSTPTFSVRLHRARKRFSTQLAAGDPATPARTIPEEAS